MWSHMPLHALDRLDVLAITATGSGKSAYVHKLMPLLQAFSRDPQLNPSGVHDREILVVSPTTALELKIR